MGIRNSESCPRAGILIGFIQESGTLRGPADVLSGCPEVRESKFLSVSHIYLNYSTSTNRVSNWIPTYSILKTAHALKNGKTLNPE
jgi:hypothetical protein